MNKQLVTLFIITIFCLANGNAQHQLDVEGDIKLDNQIDFTDSSSGNVMKVGSIIAKFPEGANAANSPSITIATETNPIPSNGQADIILESSDQIYLNTNKENRLYVGPSGRVGIGTETPDLKLHVRGDAVIGGGSVKYTNNAEYLRLAAQKETWYIGALNEDTEARSDFYIGQTGASSGIFHIENGGDIGIGTAEPVTKLHVVDAGPNPMRLEASTNNNYTTLHNNTGYVGYYGAFNGETDMDFGTGSSNLLGKIHLAPRATPRLTVEPSGQVGIGTQSPTADLHVTGGNGGVRMILESDEDNAGGESEHPRFTFVQDGGLTTADLGYYSNSNDFRIRNNSGTGSQILIKSNGDIIIGN